MTVYVDDMHLDPMGQFGRMKMCHMIADTTEELLSMAEKIGVSHWHLQHASKPREHFDIATSKRTLAVKYGAVEITMRQAACMTGRRGVEKILGKPEDAIAWRLARNAERV